MERDPDIGSLISVTRSCDLRTVGLKEASGSTGASDIDEFERWLVQLLKFYQTNKMCGRRADFLRVIHVGRHLSGEASDWYESHVYSIERDPHIRWMFLEVIRHLFRVFIDESTLQLAVQSYYRVKYSEDKGVYSYIRELEKKANRCRVPESIA